MEHYQALLSTLALSMGVSWASGINLYAALLVLGIGGATGNIELPASLQVLADPMVIVAAGLMYAAEFFVDKTPGVDTGWDALHTFIRIPAGAMLAAGAVGEVTPALEIAAGIMGGSLSAASHATKAGGRVLINTSPEPFSNWAASIGEDIMVVAGLWAALNHPVLFLIFIIVFMALVIWLLPKLLRLIRSLVVKVGRWLGFVRKDDAPDAGFPGGGQNHGADNLGELERLATLHRQGELTDEEFTLAKAKVLNPSA